MLAENAEALRLLERLGDTVQRRDGSQVELDIELPAPPEPSPQIKLVLAGAARGLVIPAISMWRQVADFAYARRRRGRGGRAGQRDRGARLCGDAASAGA